MKVELKRFYKATHSGKNTQRSDVPVYISSTNAMSSNGGVLFPLLFIYIILL